MELNEIGQKQRRHLTVTTHLQVTGIPENKYESFQILQYKEGQFYRRHHDSSNTNKNKPAGHRVLTFFLYLNDVEEGGETRFTNLDISVTPKKVCRFVWIISSSFLL